MQVDEVAHLVSEEQGAGTQIPLMFGPGHEQALLLLQLQARPLRLVALELRVCRQAAGGGIGQLPVRHLTGWRQIGIGIAQQGGLIEPAFRGPGDLAGLHVPVELALAALVARVLQVGHGIQLRFIDADGRLPLPPRQFTFKLFSGTSEATHVLRGRIVFHTLLRLFFGAKQKREVCLCRLPGQTQQIIIRHDHLHARGPPRQRDARHLPAAPHVQWHLPNGG